MSRRISLGIALAAAVPLLWGAGTARAQGAAKPVAAPQQVDGFSPRSGRPGTRVTVTGAGFIRGTKVLVAGRAARVSSLSAGKIVFAVPPDVFAGAEVVLRIPGVANDIAVGNFEVLVDPVIRTMSPASGAPGTKVELGGRGFKTADTFTLGGTTLITESIQPERAIVTVPEGATTDHVSLVRPNGEKARSSVRFRVNPSAPVISGVSPELGAPGTTVRLNGTGFTARDRIYYGGRSSAMKILGRGAGSVDVLIPKSARQSQPITLVGPGGTARSPRPFQLDLPPVVASFSPRLGSAGTQVEITGDHFRDGDWVSLAGKRMPIVQLRERQISIKIPPGSRTGPIAIGRDSFTAVARGAFEVLNPPNLVAFMPTRGEVGTRVTLSGQHLAGGKVYYGARQVKVLETRGEGTLVVQVPAGARDDRLRVRTRAGEAETHRPFQVLVLAAVTEVAPRSVGAGGTLELRGRNLDKATRFFIGSLPLEIESREPRRATVRLPVDARTAPLEWLSQGVRSRTGFPVNVLAPPRIAQFQPMAGAPGTKIIIRGQSFHRGAEVFFGKVPMRVVGRRGEHELVAVVPRGVGGVEHLVVRSQGSRARSDQTFAVRVPPVILSMSPSRAQPGAQVLVEGRWFDDSTEILFGKMRARVLKRDKGTILVEVPRSVSAGAYPLVAKTDQLQSTFRQTFQVVARAAPGRWDRTGWEMLGSRVVDGKTDRDVIEVGARAGVFTRLMLLVEDSDLEMFDVVIEFANGQKHAPRIRHSFREDTRTRAIDLPGNKRAIRRITFRYGNLPGGGRARVEVWAQAATAAAPAPPPARPRSAPPSSAPAPTAAKVRSK